MREAALGRETSSHQEKHRKILERRKPDEKSVSYQQKKDDGADVIFIYSEIYAIFCNLLVMAAEAWPADRRASVMPI